MEVFEKLYIGRDNVIARQLLSNESLIADHSSITRVIVKIGDTSYDSSTHPEWFHLGLTDRIEFMLGSAGIAPGKYWATIIAFTASSTLGTSYSAFLIEAL